MSEHSSRFTPREISVFCSQISYLLKAGVPLYEGTGLLCEDMEPGRVRDALTIIDGLVKENVPLHEALKKAGVFPNYLLHMVEIGEMSGRLDDVMDALSLYYDREEALKARIKSAIVYPVFLFIMMAAVVLILVIKVLPMFNKVFEELGGEMSGTGTAVMTVGLAIGKYAAIFIGVVALIVIVCLIWSRTKSGKRAFSRLSATFGPTKKLTVKIAAGRFASAMSMMLASGLDIDASLETAAQTIDNEYLSGKIDKCRGRMAEGLSFTDALSEAAIFPSLFNRMINIGFKTGSTDSVMKKLADLYDDEIDTSLGNITSLIEPTLVAILSIVVGIILISVMLPLVGIMSSIG